MLRFIISILSLYLCNSVQAIQLPRPKGPLKIGTITFELTDHSRLDPFAPTPQNRSLELSLHYPVAHGDNLPFSTYLPPLTAQLVERRLALPAGALGNITTHAHLNASILDGGRKTPVILLSPEDGGSRLFYTTLAQDLASEGYVVVSIDHPYDSIIVELSDGRDIARNITNTPETVDVDIAVRAADASFVLDELATGQNFKLGGLQGGLDTAHVGFLGHSLGGAAAATTMVLDGRVVGGVDMDGSFVGPDVQRGFSQPFMIMARLGHNRTTDPTWAQVWPKLRGFKLEIEVEGAIHETFTDGPVVSQLLGLNNNGSFGTISGPRFEQIQHAYLTAFFDFALKGKKKNVLGGPVKKFPEVSFEP